MYWIMMKSLHNLKEPLFPPAIRQGRVLTSPDQPPTEEMMENRITLEQLRKMQVNEIANLSPEELAMLCEELSALKADTKLFDNRLHAGLVERFSKQAAEARKAQGKDTGTVRLSADGYVVVADLPKDVDWDQAELKKSVEIIASQGEPVEQYVNIKYAVPESKYNAWPESLKAIFAPARSVGVGRETFKFNKEAQ
jgi:hypothetical protein